MFTIQHLWIVKRGKGSKIMGAVEHSCWNCANIYKLVRRYFASPVSLNQQALLVKFSFASLEEFLFFAMASIDNFRYYMIMSSGKLFNFN